MESIKRSGQIQRMLVSCGFVEILKAEQRTALLSTEFNTQYDYGINRQLKDGTGTMANVKERYILSKEIHQLDGVDTLLATFLIDSDPDVVWVADDTNITRSDFQKYRRNDARALWNKLINNGWKRYNG